MCEKVWASHNSLVKGKQRIFPSRALFNCFHACARSHIGVFVLVQQNKITTTWYVLLTTSATKGSSQMKFMFLLLPGYGITVDTLPRVIVLIKWLLLRNVRFVYAFYGVYTIDETYYMQYVYRDTDYSPVNRSPNVLHVVTSNIYDWIDLSNKLNKIKNHWHCFHFIQWDTALALCN